MMRWSLPTLLLLIVAPANAADPPAKATPEQVEFFEKKVRPLFVEHCAACHGEKKQQAGLRLDTTAGLKAGADSGPLFVAGKPAESRLLKSVKREGDFPMPPKKALPPEAVAVLTEWVKGGAAYPEDAVGIANDPKKHWAFQPVRPVTVPNVANPKGETRNEIDAFVLAQLAKVKLEATPVADRRTLIRRAYFDLTGLPPTADEMEAFEKDQSPNAWEKVIDHLLASPRYGERWGRYWLDVARYADTKGYVFQEERAFPYSYTYRDYVVRSFNEDKPFDRFVIEQLAADRLPLGDDKQPLAAMGFLTLGRRFLNNQQDIIDDRIDVVGRGLMGLTLACARCHDHKFDPIPAADYYSLYGVFASSTEPKELPLIGEVKRTPELIAFEKEIEKREVFIKDEIATRYRTHMKKLREPVAVADYVRGVLESKNKPDGQMPAFIRERDLTLFVFNRWRAFLNTELKAWSPVFGPLVVLSDVPEKDFTEKFPEILATLAKHPKMPGSPLVLQALKDAKPKTFKAAVEAVTAAMTAAPPVGPPSQAETELRKVLATGGPLDIALADAEKLFNRADRDAVAAIQKRIEAFKATNPNAPPRAHVLNDSPSPVQPVVFLRGNINNRGPAVLRQAPAIVSHATRKPFTDGSGRLELAKSIASAENPLTARVFVNRVWAGHFGNGLVRTPSDFGVRSDPPTHPELLDWLASRFVTDGWSVKKLHKLIMTSAAYQRTSAVSAGAYKLDPANLYLSHQTRRRLDFEATRDSLLFASGQLDLTVGGKAVDLFKAPFSSRRSVYGLIDRTSFPGTMRAFDVANPDTHSPQRFQTTTPQQALFLMNSPFVTQQATALAARSELTAAKTPVGKVIALYRVALSRNPTADEILLALEFTAEDDPKPTFGKWPQLAQVLLLSNEFAFAD